jgi:hypothetical protein
VPIVQDGGLYETPKITNPAADDYDIGTAEDVYVENAMAEVQTSWAESSDKIQYGEVHGGQGFSKTWNDMLDRVPPMEGTIYRGLRLDEKTLQELLTTKEMTFNASQSFSLSPNIAERFAANPAGKVPKGHDIKVVFQAKAKTAVPFYVSPHAQVEENEVIARMGSKYKIVGAVKSPVMAYKIRGATVKSRETDYIIQLEEI